MESARRPESGDVVMTGFARSYTLLLLTLVYVVAYLDRQVLAILLEPIKREFGVSDTLLGLLAGPAFALFYATLGVPLALLADRVSRRNIIAVSLALFSLATLASAAAAKFFQLVTARVMTGIGEAGTGPSAQSIIADLYPPAQRSTAQAVYASGLNIGLMLAFFFGGWIVQAHGWRMAFLAASLPGILLACLMLTVREPLRGASEVRASANALPLGRVISFLWSQRSYRMVVMGTAMSAFAGYGILAFLPSFLVRSHHMAPTDIGLIFALILGVGGGTATFLGGFIADRWGRNDVRATLSICVIAPLVSLPFWPVLFLAPDTSLALMAAVVPASLAGVYLGPCMSVMQGLAPLRMRATAAALQLFVANLVGLGLGPQVIGIVSDALQPQFHEQSLRYALLLGALPTLLAAFFYFRARGHLEHGFRRAQSFDSEGMAPG